MNNTSLGQLKFENEIFTKAGALNGILLKITKSFGSNIKTLPEELENKFNTTRHLFIKKIRKELKQQDYIIVLYSLKPEDLFINLINAEFSIEEFRNEIVQNYNEQINVSDEISILNFLKAGDFEIQIKISAFRKGICLFEEIKDENDDIKIVGESSLLKLIEELYTKEIISQSAKEKLSNGNSFLNLLKHFKGNFPCKGFNSWQEGINAIEEAWLILKENSLYIFNE